jgi:hypothetical protein
MQEFIEKGPTQEELDRVRSNYFSNFLKGIERIGGLEQIGYSGHNGFTADRPTIIKTP